jgi:hypothetical protein
VNLDFSRFDAFYRNPEKYRLHYELNLVPAQKNYYLERGIAFHLMLEYWSNGKRAGEIDLLVAREVQDLKAIATAKRMFAHWLQRYNPSGPIILAAEPEFLQQLPNSPHSICGKIDQILEIDGRQWVGEVKTTNVRNTFAKISTQWATRKQAEFELIGAQALGYKPLGLLVRTVVESSPPKIWELVVKRTAYQLELVRLAVHQTCEMIEFMRRTFGIDQPWPHSENSWPCMNKEKCEYGKICGVSRPEQDTSGFKQREEHLAILRHPTHTD